MGFDSSLDHAMVCYGMGMLVSSLLRPLLVELSSSLLEVVLAGRLAETLGHDRALFEVVSWVRGTGCKTMTYRVGAVVLGGSLAAAGGVVLDIVHGVGGCVRVRGLLCNHVGEVCTRVSTMKRKRID